jgi:hypothetical protein
MEKDPLLLQNQVDVMDGGDTDRMEVLKKNDGPSRAKIKSICISVLHV